MDYREKGFPKLGVPSPCNKDHGILGFIGVPLVWETTIYINCQAKGLGS